MSPPFTATANTASPMTPRPALAGLAGLLLALAAGSASAANDFPTVDRVLYVQACMRDNPGGYYEMVNKCSCALDRFAEEVSFDDYTSMATIVNAISIGGERGNDLRDNDTLKPQITRYRAMQAKVKAACFIGTGGPR